MIILGVETSCDETSAAIVEDGVKIHSNVVASSIEMHKKTGGIIPEQAAREQIKCIIPVIDEAMKGFKIEDIDAIAVTYGPGLIGSLLVGIETAKTLAYVWKKPIVPVNHLVGHIYANFIGEIRNSKFEIRNKIEFPAMMLIVSGGHTELVLMKNHGLFEFVGGTRDDAAGEAFDKVARLLGLSYPGGPSIQKAAEIYHEKIKNQRSKIKDQTKDQNFKLPRPMIDSKDFDFSFSGLKTYVLNLTKSITDNHEKVAEMAFEVQEAITDVLVKKTFEAAEKFNVKSILLAGGVSANKRLREKIIEKVRDKFILSIPPFEFCTDNAGFIASAGFFNYKPVPLNEIIVDPGLEII